jgi:ABC-type multidrug transport system ATPase subunit
VAADALAYRYGGRRRPRGGFAGVDLELEPGSIVGVLGPNGAGKSTLLQVVAMRVRPTSGTLHVLGASADRATPALRRRIGFAGDEPVHFSDLTGAENALFFARAGGVAADLAGVTVARLLERFGLAEEANRPVREYSLGMRRKLLLVEALVPAPELLVLDEPTLGLDPAGRSALGHTLAEATQRGAATLLATNDLAAAETLCDRVLLLHEGSPVVEGEPAVLLARLGEGEWIEVDLAAAATPVLALDGIDVLEASPLRLRLRARHGASVLPSLCAALLDQGCAVRSLRVRPPDLGDVFRATTGAQWPIREREIPNAGVARA